MPLTPKQTLLEDIFTAQKKLFNQEALACYIAPQVIRFIGDEHSHDAFTEIDFLIERDDHALLGIEVKAGSAINAADFKHLKWFRDHLAKDRPFVGIILYSGEYAGPMGNGLWAVPFGCLWE